MGHLMGQDVCVSVRERERVSERLRGETAVEFSNTTT